MFGETGEGYGGEDEEARLSRLEAEQAVTRR
jgi:hypothetical protein